VCRNSQPRLWAALQIELGSDWMEDPQADPVDKVERAIQAYRRALSVPEITPSAREAPLSNLTSRKLHNCQRVKGLRRAKNR
jgi:hypothetical protein